MFVSNIKQVRAILGLLQCVEPFRHVADNPSRHHTLQEMESQDFGSESFNVYLLPETPKNSCPLTAHGCLCREGLVDCSTAMPEVGDRDLYLFRREHDKIGEGGSGEVCLSMFNAEAVECRRP